MESGWKKVARTFGLNACVITPRVGGEGEESGASRSTGSAAAAAFGSRRVSDSASLVATVASPRGSVGSSDSGLTTPASSLPISGRIRRTLSGSRSSKKTCAICMESMKVGVGHALFTAECSHVFHFHCIASSVTHGNLVCPVCRAKWKELPFQGPVSTENSQEGSRVNPVVLLQDDGHLSAAPLASPPPPPFRVGQQNHFGSHLNASEPNMQNRYGPRLTASEPSIFNDDDPLHESSESATEPHQDGVTTVDIMTYTEFSALPQSASLENFNVLIHLKAPNATSNQDPGRNLNASAAVLQNSRAPIDLVTVIDVSGSMAGTKIALLKRAMGFVIQNLGPSDRLSVVSFSSNARRLFPLLQMSESGRQRALHAVNSLVANGGTHIAEGLRKGAKVIEDRRVRNPVCSIILLSDGQDTYTLPTSRSLETPDYGVLVPPSIRDATSRQMQVHAFGFGSDHDSSALHSISEISGGTFSFIESENVIQVSFAQCIGGLLSVVVQEMKVFLKTVHPEVRIAQIQSGNYTNKVADNSRSGLIYVGDLYADEERDFLVSINVSQASSESVLLKVGSTYKDPISKELFALEDKEVRIERPEVVASLTPSIEVDRQRNRVQVTKAMSEAKVAADRGALSEAVSILEEQRRKLSESLAGRAHDILCMALDEELKEMQERMSTRRRYESSGRAYMLSGMSSHSWQRATARTSSTGNSDLMQAYQTPNMARMVHLSQTIYHSGGQPPQGQPKSS